MFYYVIFFQIIAEHHIAKWEWAALGAVYCVGSFLEKCYLALALAVRQFPIDSHVPLCSRIRVWKHCKGHEIGMNKDGV